MCSSAARRPRTDVKCCENVGWTQKENHMKGTQICQPNAAPNAASELAPQKSRNAATGFTLIELLVVIAIIAVLAAILFPVFAKAREKGRQTACLSNIKQLGLGMLQYTQDFDETYPQSVSERESAGVGVNDPTTAAQWSIRGHLGSYIPGGLSTSQNSNIFHCPDGVIAWPAQATSGAPSAAVVYWPSDYGFNFNEANIAAAASPHQTAFQTADPSPGVGTAGVNDADFGFNETVKIGSVANTAQFIIVGDSDRSDGTISRGGMFPEGSGPTDPAPFNCEFAANPAELHPYARHSLGCNFGFADGHAKWQRPDATWTNHFTNEWRRNPS